MDTLAHILALDNTGKLLVLLIICGGLLLLAAGSPIYLYYLRRKDAPRREEAQAAHGTVLQWAHLQEQLVALMTELRTIEKTLNTLSMMGPDRVIVRLEEVRDKLNSCIGQIECLRRDVRRDKS